MEQCEADLLTIEEVLATLGERPDSSWCETPIAGLQYYAYDDVDELTGEVLRPQPWERVQLVRQPQNPKDRNAVQVLYHNGQYQLGHLPRELAAGIAPAMDAGRDLRGYALSSGSGEAWSVSLLLVGKAVPAERQRKSVEIRQQRQEWAARWAYYEGERSTEAARRDCAIEARAKLEAIVFQRDRLRRLRDAVEALLPIAPDIGVELPAGFDQAPPERGVTYGWWDQVPPCLATKNVWREHGRSVPGKAEPWAWISYGHRRKGRVTYKLYAYEQTRPVAMTPSVVAGFLRDLDARIEGADGEPGYGYEFNA
ncbi:HIRAN domain-containing protein [Microvirga tunisiensis]|uniref:HIRAN domain-containing protein n=1 Tax=Microvirga tunisiensis TaxID=2108360 RepID=A0A5N7MIR7_9HYPH|nr:HIRAN domain-containing protein [Microvirga tunisiensis]MPR06203.1 hypothetical protein [Microvirga tunisiensis]MPR26054.1 hypothetical protein [Microvirga tunisiensis]